MTSTSANGLRLPRFPSSKFSVPVVPTGLVQRPRLVERLDSGRRFCTNQACLPVLSSRGPLSRRLLLLERVGSGTLGASASRVALTSSSSWRCWSVTGG